MIRQDQRTTGRSNSGRQAPADQRNYNRSTNLFGLENLFGGGGTSTQTTTQQNLPDWAIPDAMSTLAMGNYYTQNPDYRASTLDRDYSGLRGYDQMGRPNSQVGQFGLNPSGYNPPQNLDNLVSQRTADLQNQTLSIPGMGRITIPNGGLESNLLSGRGLGRSTGWWDSEDEGEDDSNEDSGWSFEIPQIDLPDLNFDSLVEDTWLDNRPQSDPGELAYPTSLPETPTQSPQGDIRPDGSNSEGPGYPTGNDPPATQTQPTSSEGSNTNTQSNTTTTTQPTIEPRDIFNPDDLTPFQAYDRQRFAAPGQDTLRGEGILSGRYDQRFGPGGTDPFAAANAAVETAANYQSGFQGTTGGIGGQAGNYQANLANASNPGVFQSRDYTAGLQNFANPNAGVGNVNQGLTANQFGSANQGLQANQYGNATSGVGNVNANVRSNQYGNANQGLRANQYGNVNQGIQAAQYGNASQGLQGTQNYNRNYQDLVQQSFNPFQDQVVNQTIKDLDRARQITNNEISGSAAKAGAFGSREALMRAENNRNFFDRVGSAVGQLRSQGFESAANRASQENLQRLGLTASDVQNVRGIQNQGSLQGQSLTADAERQRQALMSQGGLQGQNLTAASQQQLNSLLSQGNLQGQNLGAASDQQANALRSQGALAAQDLQGRGALQGQNLTASAQNQLNSLLSQGNLQGQQLSASDMQNVRNLISQGGLTAQGLQSQGALAALGANADLYSRALGLNSASDLAALQANAGLLSDAMRLDASDLNQRRNLASNEAQFAETANRGAGALNLQGGQALGQLAQAGTADERQRIADMLASGQAQTGRNQQDLDFIFNEFNRELAYPGQQIDLRNAAISPATGSIVTTTQPRYQQNPILGGLGAAMGTYGMTSNPYLAGAAGILSLLG